MKKISEYLLLLFTTIISGCSAIAGIFKMGFWSGIIIVAIVAVVIFIIVTSIRNSIK